MTSTTITYHGWTIVDDPAEGVVYVTDDSFYEDGFASIEHAKWCIDNDPDLNPDAAPAAIAEAKRFDADH